MNVRVKIGVAAVALAMITTACGGSDSTDSGESSTPTAPKLPSKSPSTTVQIVAIGDSNASGKGDASGGGWVSRYAELVQDKIGQPVTVHNLAMDGRTSDQLRKNVAEGTATRQNLANADVILIGIGGGDLNPGDDALRAHSCQGRDCYTKILEEFDANMAAIASEARKLAPDALLMAMSGANSVPGAGDSIPSFITDDIGVYQVMTERTSVCDALEASDGQCVDVVSAFNGADGTADAYAAGLMSKDPCCYPSSKGHQKIAELLFATGVPPAK